MRFVIKLVISLVLAVGLGYGSARWAIGKVASTNSVHNGPWAINTTIGSDKVDPYSKAMVALRGLLALNKSEAIYFTAYTDSVGEPLSGHCSYTVSGEGPAARWWSITAYGADSYLIASSHDRFAVTMHDFGSGSFSFPVRATIDATEIGLATSGEKNFSLTLRAYNPEPALLNSLASVALPAIEKGACDE